MVKRYLVFAFDVYYPVGGWNDFKNSFDIFKEACEYVDKIKLEYKHVQIVDLYNNTVICEV